MWPFLSNGAFIEYGQEKSVWSKEAQIIISATNMPKFG